VCSYLCDIEVMHSDYRCAKHDLPCDVVVHGKYGLQFEICAREVIWRVNNSRKSVIFYDVLYHLNVIFLQRVFEGLKSIFSNAKPREQSVMRHTVSL
jgi:hypothetical protein